jgi:hypothetical protein
MDCGIGCNTNQVSIPDQVHSSDDDWDLEYPPNPEIEECIHTFEGESNESEGREAEALQNCSYVDLHVVHENRASRWRVSGRGRGAARVSIGSYNVGATNINNVGGRGCTDSLTLSSCRLSQRGRGVEETSGQSSTHGHRPFGWSGLDSLSPPPPPQGMTSQPRKMPTRKSGSTALRQREQIRNHVGGTVQ